MDPSAPRLVTTTGQCAVRHTPSARSPNSQLRSLSGRPAPIINRSAPCSRALRLMPPAMSSSRRSRHWVATCSSSPTRAACCSWVRAAAIARFNPPRASSRLGQTRASGSSWPLLPPLPRNRRALMVRRPRSVEGFAIGTMIRSGRRTTSPALSSMVGDEPSWVFGLA